MIASWKEDNGKPRRHIKKQRHHFSNKGPYSQGYGLSSSHAQMWELDSKKLRVLKNWCFWTVVLENILESPLDSKEMKPVNLKGDQPWIFTGRADAEAPGFWLFDANRRLIGKDPDAGKRLKAEGEEGNRQRDGWMASLIRWTWTWANSRRWWGTGMPGVLQFMGLQRVRHNLATEQQCSLQHYKEII